MRELLQALLYTPLIADPGLSYLVISFDRVVLAVLALHMVVRLAQSAAVLLPRRSFLATSRTGCVGGGSC